MPAVLHYAGARLELHEELDGEGARNLIAEGWRQSKSVNATQARPTAMPPAG